MRVAAALLFLVAATLAGSCLAQEVFEVAPGVLFVPQNGVALDSRNGHVLWRYPRYLGRTYSNGDNLLLVSHLAGFNKLFHFSQMQICRLHPTDGRVQWCHSAVHLTEAVVDVRQSYLYLIRGNRLDLINLETGRRERTLPLRNSSGQLFALDTGGALLVSSDRSHTVLTVIDPASGRMQTRDVARYLYAFEGHPAGVLLYDSQRGTFLDPMSLAERYKRQASPEAPFPRASVCVHGFVTTDWNNTGPFIAGQAAQSSVWTYGQFNSEPRLALVDRLVTSMELRHGPAGRPVTMLNVVDLANGREVLSLSLDSDFEMLSAGASTLALLGSTWLAAFDLERPHQLWQIPSESGRSVVVASNAVILAQRNALVAYDRVNGTLLWRVQFHTLGVT